ncbi:MAG TPA: phospholipid carrier-dependent glycosyltransferase [Acidimicrobiales bacterium]|nr:phospholipid carrier-dependent glycosyltransferase [Acidimicrobiales bacterium]
MSTRQQRWTIAVLIGVVVLVRVALVLAVHADHPDRAITDDTPGYTDPARSLVDDGDFDLEPGSSAPEFQRTPGYPAFLGVIYRLTDDGDTGNAVALAVQAALSGLSVLLALLAARRLSGSFAVALAVGLMVGLDPLQAAQSGLVVSETLATLFTTLAVYAAVRALDAGLSVGWAVAAGLSLAAATYVRPTTYYFPLLVLLALGAAAVWQRRDAATRRTILLGAVAFALPCLVLLGAWDVRNHQRVDSWKFSGLEGTNLYWYRAASVQAARDGTGLEATQVQLTEQLSRGLVPPFDYEDYRSGEPPPAWQHRQGEYYDRAQRAGLDILRDEPVLAAREYARAVYGQVVQSGWRSAFEYVLGDSPPTLLVAPGLLVVWGIEALAVVGAVAALRRPGPQRWTHVLIVGLAVYVIAVTAAGPDAGGGYRFRIPIWPIWCLYAAFGLQALRGWWQVSRKPASTAVR